MARLQVIGLELEEPLEALELFLELPVDANGNPRIAAVVAATTGCLAAALGLAAALEAAFFVFLTVTTV